MAAPFSPADTPAFDPQYGRPVPIAEGLVRLTAGNAGPFTQAGTNSFIIGHDAVAVVDPGPNDGAHFEALLAAIAGRPVMAVILTHSHSDHAALARRLAAASSAPIWMARPADKAGIVPDRVLVDGERLEVGGVTLEVIATPGHASDHLALGIVGTDMLLVGDHVMGWSSTLVAAPDGRLDDYFASLDKVIALPYRVYHSAHGAPVTDGPGHASALKRHRMMRNEQIIAALQSGVGTPSGLLRRIYPGLKLGLIPGARSTLAAHIDYLAEQGAIIVRRGWFRTRLSLPGQG